MTNEILLIDFLKTTDKFSADRKLSTKIFDDLLKRYAESGRYYHTLTHIKDLLAEMHAYYGESIPDEVFFAVWFHDAIYAPVLGNSEAKSAALAAEKLMLLNAPKEIMSKVEVLILKTASHMEAEADDADTKIFLDADMRILGVDQEQFLQYTKAVRKEYSMFPDLLFNRGRKKFIEKMLGTKRIYKSEIYFKNYEQQARKNLLNELNLLQ